MTHSYEKYISRLRSLREQRPELKAYQRNIETETPLLTKVGREATANMQRSGASVASQAAVLQQQQGDIANIHRTAYNDALSAGEQRNATIDSKIADVSFAQDQAREQEQQQKDARKAGLLKGGMQVGGAALGAVAGSVVPGVGTMLGTKLGSAGGQMLSSFVGDNSKLATDNFNAEEFNQGLQDTISGISGALTLKTQKATMGELSQHMASIDSLSVKDLAMVRGYIENGDVEEALNYLKMIKGNAPALTTPMSESIPSIPDDIAGLQSYYNKRRGQ